MKFGVHQSTLSIFNISIIPTTKKIFAHLRNLPHPKWRSLAPSNGIAEQGPGC